MAAYHEEQLLVGGRIARIVFVDHEVTGRAGRPHAGAECRKPQMEAYRPVVTACVVELLDLVQVRRLPTSHSGPPFGRCRYLPYRTLPDAEHRPLRIVADHLRGMRR